MRNLILSGNNSTQLNSTQLNSTQLNSTDLNFLKNKIFIKFLSVLFGYIKLDNLSKRNLRLVINNFKLRRIFV